MHNPPGIATALMVSFLASFIKTLEGDRHWHYSPDTFLRKENLPGFNQNAANKHTVGRFWILDFKIKKFLNCFIMGQKFAVICFSLLESDWTPLSHIPFDSSNQELSFEQLITTIQPSAIKLRLRNIEFSDFRQAPDFMAAL